MIMVLLMERKDREEALRVGISEHIINKMRLGQVLNGNEDEEVVSKDKLYVRTFSKFRGKIIVMPSLKDF